MRKKRGGERMSLPLLNVNSPKRTKQIRKRKNRLIEMSSEDWKEANEVTKSSRGVSKLSLKDIYGEENK